MEATVINGKINRSRSRLTIKAFAAGLLSSFGHDPTFSARDISGDLSFVPDDPKSAKLNITVRTNSIEVTGDISSKDRKDIEKTMRDEVLQIDRFPEVTFESTSVDGEKVFENQYRVQIKGNLSLRGVTNPQTIEAQVTVNGDQVRAYGDFTLRQTDYGIKLVSVAGGALKLKDEVKFSFDIAAQS
jgi:polyisoprenoid-binding protein YceI